VLTYLLFIALSGLVVGGLARLVIPGPDPMGLLQTMAIGIAGSFLAGLVALAIFDGRSGGGLLLSVAFSAGLVLLVRRSRDRGASHAGTHRRPGSVF
jgi:uncharacterized membrane protein YeaQ/YmgE (transglycosylase-associated protein family)